MTSHRPCNQHACYLFILPHLTTFCGHLTADLAILKNAKAGVEARNSVCHSAVIFANAIMHAGTTVDSFLRDNLDWLSRATNWAKFGATAGLGVIHRGHLSQVCVFVFHGKLSHCCCHCDVLLHGAVGLASWKCVRNGSELLDMEPAICGVKLTLVSHGKGHHTVMILA